MGVWDVSDYRDESAPHSFTGCFTGHLSSLPIVLIYVHHCSPTYEDVLLYWWIMFYGSQPDECWEVLITGWAVKIASRCFKLSKNLFVVCPTAQSVCLAHFTWHYMTNTALDWVNFMQCRITAAKVLQCSSRINSLQSQKSSNASVLKTAEVWLPQPYGPCLPCPKLPPLPHSTGFASRILGLFLKAGLT